MTIELHGFSDEAASHVSDIIWGKLQSSHPDDQKEFIISNSKTSLLCRHRRNAQIIRVYSTDTADFKSFIEIARSIPLNGLGMQFYVECVLLTERIQL